MLAGKKPTKMTTKSTEADAQVSTAKPKPEANCGIKTQDGELQQETNFRLQHRNFAYKRKYQPLVVDHGNCRIPFVV